MALKPNAVMKFTGYEFTDSGVTLRFLCEDPGAGEQSIWEVGVTDAELASVSNVAQFGQMVMAKMTRRYRQNTQLDNLIGRQVTI